MALTIGRGVARASFVVRISIECHDPEASYGTYISLSQESYRLCHTRVESVQAEHDMKQFLDGM